MYWIKNRDRQATVTWVSPRRNLQCYERLAAVRNSFYRATRRGLRDYRARNGFFLFSFLMTRRIATTQASYTQGNFVNVIFNMKNWNDYAIFARSNSFLFDKYISISLLLVAISFSKNFGNEYKICLYPPCVTEQLNILRFGININQIYSFRSDRRRSERSRSNYHPPEPSLSPCQFFPPFSRLKSAERKRLRRQRSSRERGATEETTKDGRARGGRTGVYAKGEVYRNSCIYIRKRRGRERQRRKKSNDKAQRKKGSRRARLSLRIMSLHVIA